MRELLKNPGFRSLLGAQMILALGDACLRMGLLEVFKRCGLDVEVETAKMFFALTLPGLVFGPFAMILLDRWERKSVLVVSDLLRAVVMVALVAWLFGALHQAAPPTTLRVIYALVLVNGIIVTFYLPARYAVFPNLVADHQLIQANTLLTVSMAVLAVGGMPLGGWLAVRWGPIPTIALNGIAYLVAAVILSRMPLRRASNLPPTGPDAPASAAQLKEGVRYLWRHPTVLPLVVVAAVFAFLGGVLMVTIVGYAEKTLGLGTLGLGWLGGAAGVGAGVGVVLLGGGKAWTRSIWLPAVQLIIGGVLMAALSLTRDVLVAVPLLMMLGGICATALIPIDAKLQEEIADDRRGSVFAARGILTSGTMLAAFWLKFGTDLLRTTPPPVILQWCGGGALVIAVMTVAVLRRRHRRTVLSQANG